MKKFCLISILVILTGCLGGQTQNSHSYDANLGLTGNCSNPADTKLCKAMIVIQKQCVDCHDQTHNAWAGLDTSEKWVLSGRVAAGDPNGSPLILRLKNSGSNMPKDKPVLSEADYQILRDWITNIP